MEPNYLSKFRIELEIQLEHMGANIDTYYLEEAIINKLSLRHYKQFTSLDGNRIAGFTIKDIKILKERK